MAGREYLIRPRVAEPVAAGAAMREEPYGEHLGHVVMLDPERQRVLGRVMVEARKPAAVSGRPTAGAQLYAGEGLIAPVGSFRPGRAWNDIGRAVVVLLAASDAERLTYARVVLGTATT